MTGVVVIPARMGSTRFPGKPLVLLAGKPMVQWVYEAALRAGVGEVLIATPDDEIAAAARAFGANPVLTRLDHPSGTDRLAEVATHHTADYYINVQGDEPLIDPEDIRTLDFTMRQESPDAASLFVPCEPSDLNNPAVVKVVTDRDGFAMYFSRSLIPYPRAAAPTAKRHLGVYAYRREVLKLYPTLSQTPLELAESLEQLRLLENGIRIMMREGRGSPVSVDTPEQAAEASAYLAQRS